MSLYAVFALTKPDNFIQRNGKFQRIINKGHVTIFVRVEQYDLSFNPIIKFSLNFILLV